MASIDDLAGRLDKLIDATLAGNQSNEQLKSLMRDVLMQKAATASLAGAEVPDLMTAVRGPEFGLGSAQGRKLHNEERMKRLVRWALHLYNKAMLCPVL